MENNHTVTLLRRPQNAAPLGRPPLVVAYGWLVVPVIMLSPGCVSPLSISPTGSAERFLTGVFLGDKDLEARYRAYVELTDTRPQLLMTFMPWPKKGASLFPAAFCRFAHDRHAVPIITWEPWEPWSGWYPMLADIAAGDYDPRIRSLARAARRGRHTVLLRFAHEMNGDWYPWSERKDPRQTAEAYVSAWRRIRRGFADAGADNVQFVWSVNFEPADRLDRFYPGDAFVDWIGVDMYNQPDWPRSPGEMLQPAYEFAAARHKPMILTEVGSAERFTGRLQRGPASESPSKARWIEALFRILADRQNVRGLVWFDIDKEADWRIGSSPSSTAAYCRGLRALDTSGTRNQ